MAHDWGVTVPPGLPLETLIEMRDGLRSGAVKVETPRGLEDNEQVAVLMDDLKNQMIAAYDEEVRRWQH